MVPGIWWCSRLVAANCWWIHIVVPAPVYIDHKLTYAIADEPQQITLLKTL